MKKVILIAACLCTLSVSVKAQEVSQTVKTERKDNHQKLTAEQRAQKNVDELNTTATLTEDQKVKVKNLAIDRITKVDAIRTKYKGQAENKETMQKEIGAVRKEYRKNVHALLTPEQLEKVKAKNKEAKASGNTINDND